MEAIINGKKFKSDTSEKLVAFGNGQAAYATDGLLQVYRSPKGTLWGVFKYWSNQFGPQNTEQFTGDSIVRSYLERYGDVADVEKVFGEMEEG